MVEKIKEGKIEKIDIGFDFDKVLFKKLKGFGLEFSKKIIVESNGYSFESEDDFEKNIGLFDFGKWKINNFGASNGNAMYVELRGKTLEIYLSDINSSIQMNFYGKIKKLISDNTPIRENTIQIVKETTIVTNNRNGNLSFIEKNKDSIKLILTGAIATIIATVILKLIEII